MQVRAMMGAYCERPNVTKVSVCSNTLNFTIEKLRENIDYMEEHHHVSSAMLRACIRVNCTWLYNCRRR